MKNLKRTYISWMLLGAAVTIATLLAVRFLVPETIRIWDGENADPIGGILAVEIDQEAEEVQSLHTPETDDLQLSYTNTSGTIRLFGIIPIKEVDVEIWKQTELIPCGDIIGIDISTRGVMILGTGKIETHSGKVESPAKGQVYSGDLIHEIDGIDMKSISEITSYLENLTADPVTLRVEREGQDMTVVIQPIQDIHKEYRLGIWLRDREQGLGTLTYVDPATGNFGAVGHGITDVDTREILSVGSGTITTASIIQIVPGQNGQPGEIQGAIGSKTLGSIEYNTENGIYGELDSSTILERESYPIALKDEVKEGEGTILCSLDGSGPQEYDVYIKRNDSLIASASTFLVEITDPALLERTGGIIQGMSGSPIIQDGKLVGAVTHVLVNRADTGYGIFIEEMLEATG